MMKLYSTRQAAVCLGVRPQTLRSWRSRGVGPRYLRMGRSPHSRAGYPEQSLADFMKKTFASTASEAAVRSLCRASDVEHDPGVVRPEELKWLRAALYAFANQCVP